MKAAIIIAILFTTSFAGAERDILSTSKNAVRFSVIGQDNCEEQCFKCVSSGVDLDECASKWSFRTCCRQAGGHVSGCGCREGL